MTQDTTEAQAPDAKYAGLDECFWPVVDRFGREMFVLIFNAQVAGQATGHLAAVVERFNQGSAQGRQNAAEIRHAVMLISSAFNELSNGLCAKHGWTPEQLGECQAAIEVAWAGKVAVDSAPRIVLH